jgi:arsenite-transporting ATPase
LFGLGDELNEDAMLGRLEGMKDVIEQVNRQFKDPVRLQTLYRSSFMY